MVRLYRWIQSNLETQMNCLGMRARAVVLPTAVVVGVLVVLPMLRAKRGATSRTEETVLRLEKYIPEQMKKGNVPGLAIAMVRKGKTVWAHGFGVKESKTSQPVTEDTVF